ncbi:MAG: ABC transporter ATP-binding protein [Oscillatoriales cyanobacterium RM2_1_1]|nr:ABC transporter ATP-binding protein [Oscillatoriales cyanobacterium SM2_3_0]NJO45178.1 ABC transporter ATP-binding protein [Oscillatoriales cyanobacterium RM2_1_1]
MHDLVLDIKHLQIQFQADEKWVKAVDQISFQVFRGQTLGIVGESGSGKSVTSLAIMGLISPTARIQGEIWFGLQPQSERSGAIPRSPDLPLTNLLQLPEPQKQDYRGGQIAMIFQEPMSSLNPVYTIGFQLTEAIQQHQSVSPRQALWKAASLLQEVKLLPSDADLELAIAQDYTQNHPESIAQSSSTQSATTSNSGLSLEARREIQAQMNARKQAILNRYPHELSGGQIQRVMIAMAISCNPTLLIADEPTTALDVTVQATILDLLKELCDRRGMSMIFITHDLGVIAQVADTVAVMYRGKIVESGNAQQIFHAPQHPYTKGLLACRPNPDARIEHLPTVADYMDVIVMENGEFEIQEKPHPLPVNSEPQPVQESGIPGGISVKSSSTDPLLTVQNLRVGFKVLGALGQTRQLFMAVNDVSFEVYSGEILGLVGESGCGKSTLSRALLQLIPPLSGRVIFEGKDITAPELEGSFFSSLKNYRLQRRYVRKMRWLRRDIQIIFQNPFSSLDPRISVGETIMEPMVIHNLGQTGRERRERAAYLLDRVGLKPEFMNRYPHEFSGGQRQRVCIARALALNPKFVICDESVSALDVSVQAQVLNLLKELQAEFGLTYIFISHDLAVVKFMSDRIMVMNKGKIEEIGPADEVYYHPQAQYTRQLIASIPTNKLVSQSYG